ncbi:MAG: hypothetical protein ACLUOK_10530 [Parabacteroides distasonis]|uniref:hypothetical protein n=1 Tax=Parabacteroides distasonis TaxID=823 RepID=UPI0035B1D28E
MRKRFAILLGLIALLSVQLVYGDPVETRGKWGINIIAQLILFHLHYPYKGTF